MKIIYLHQYFVTPQMSGGTRSYELARRLVRKGFDVTIVTADCSAEDTGVGIRGEEIDGIKVIWLAVPYNNKMGFWQRIKAFFSFAFKSSLVAAKMGGDIVYATSTPLTIALPGIFASWWNRIPMILEVRDMWPAVPISIGALKNPVAKAMARLLEKVAYNWASHIVALAPGMREDVIASGIMEDKVSVIPNGADLDLFDVPEDCGLKVRADNPWLANRPMVLFTGTLGLVNGLDYLVRLAVSTMAINPNICFVLIGKGREETRIKELAEAAGVWERNFFMLGSMTKKEVPKWMSSATMVIALFTGPKVIWKDATQNKFFDALAGGKPVAGNFDGWQTRISLENDFGIYLDPVDTDVAAKILADKITDGNWLNHASETSKRLGKTRFNRDLHADQLADIFLRFS